MIDFILSQRRSYFILLIWTIVGAFSINLGVVLVAGTFILFLLKGFEREMLLGFFLMLILSDNYFLHYPGIVKPLLLVLLGIYILLRSEIRNEAMLIKSFIPFFIYTIMLWPLSDYLAIAVQKNAAYILLFFCHSSLIPSFVQTL